MALVGPKLKSDIEKAIINALKREFSKEGDADISSHKRLASAVAEGVALTIVKALQTEAQVLPGIGTAGSQSAQTSITPGKIF